MTTLEMLLSIIILLLIITIIFDRYEIRIRKKAWSDLLAKSESVIGEQRDEIDNYRINNVKKNIDIIKRG